MGNSTCCPKNTISRRLSPHDKSISCPTAWAAVKIIDAGVFWDAVFFFIIEVDMNVYYNVYKEVYMRTNIVLNDELVRLAFMCVPFIKTKKDLIETALREFVEVRKTKEIQDIRGMDLFDESYDYKAMRKGK